MTLTLKMATEICALTLEELQQMTQLKQKIKSDALSTGSGSLMTESYIMFGLFHHHI
jgi:hypothetical protein